MTAAFTPLAESLRPSSLDQVLGQPHLLGAGQPLSMALGSGKPHSMLFWGPPGSGKTTLARLVAKAGDQPLLELSAVLSGVAEIRTALAQAGCSKARAGSRCCLSTRFTAATSASNWHWLPASIAG